MTRPSLTTRALSAFWHFAPRELRHGLEIGVWLTSRKDAQPIFAKIGAALGLIEQYEPRRLIRMRRDSVRVFVTHVFGSGPYRGQYWAPLAMCLLDFDNLEASTMTPERLAMILIHEATHARIHRTSVPYTVSLRARIERACVRQEIEFARRLPQSDDLVAGAGRRLEFPQEFFSDGAIRARTFGAIRETRLPDWFIRFMERRRKGASAR